MGHFVAIQYGFFLLNKVLSQVTSQMVGSRIVTSGFVARVGKVIPSSQKASVIAHLYRNNPKGAFSQKGAVRAAPAAVEITSIIIFKFPLLAGNR